MFFDVVLFRHEGQARLRADMQWYLPVRGQVLNTDTGAWLGLVATLDVDRAKHWRLSQCRIHSPVAAAFSMYQSNCKM